MRDEKEKNTISIIKIFKESCTQPKFIIIATILVVNI